MGKHLVFDPRLREGVWLRDQGWPQAMIDVSDGLATDLYHLIHASGVGAEIETNRVPIAQAVLARPDHRPSLDRALSDGEDYELLFTVQEERAVAFEQAWAKAFQLTCTRIGRLTDERGMITCVDAQGHSTPLAVRGYEHFKDQ